MESICVSCQLAQNSLCTWRSPEELAYPEIATPFKRYHARVCNQFLRKEVI